MKFKFTKLDITPLSIHVFLFIRVFYMKKEVLLFQPTEWRRWRRPRRGQCVSSAATWLATKFRGASSYSGMLWPTCQYYKTIYNLVYFKQLTIATCLLLKIFVLKVLFPIQLFHAVQCSSVFNFSSNNFYMKQYFIRKNFFFV